MEKIDNIKDSSNRIRIARIVTNLSRKEFCERHSINYNSLSALESGKLPLSENKAEEICKALKQEKVFCSPKWLLTGKGSAPQEIKINIKKLHLPNINNLDFSKELDIYKEAEFFLTNTKNSIVIAVPDDSMSPFYQKGDLVGGIFVKENKIEPLLNKVCIIVLNNGDELIRNLSKKEGLYYFSLMNPFCKIEASINESPSIKGAAKIIWHRKLS